VDLVVDILEKVKVAAGIGAAGVDLRADDPDSMTRADGESISLE
jgi:hypothetical protein